MTTYTIPNESALVGVPGQGADTIVPGYVALITGNEPAILQTEETVAFSQTLAAFTPIGYNGSGDLIPAELGVTQAIGITIVAITTPGSGAKKGVPIYRAGCFNPNAINWPASYDTDVKKQDAFNGAPTPTSIVIRAPKAATV